MPEREKLPVEERAEEFPGTSSEIPVEVENKGVVVPTLSQFPAQVTDDKGRPLIQTPGQPVTIELPESPAQLTAFSKGNPDEASTWFGASWLMRLKKAVHFGWRVILGGQRQHAS